MLVPMWDRMTKLYHGKQKWHSGQAIAYERNKQKRLNILSSIFLSPVPAAGR
jgi:hypothetical protein